MHSVRLLRGKCIPRLRILAPKQGRLLSWSACRILADGTVRVDHDDDRSGVNADSPPGPGQVSVRLRLAPCTPADLQRLASAASVTANGSPPPRHLRKRRFPLVGGSEGLWEVIASGEGTTELRPGDLAVPAGPAGTFLAFVPQGGQGKKDDEEKEEETGTWRTTATLPEAKLVKVPVVAEGGGGGAEGRARAGKEGGGGRSALPEAESWDVEPAVAAHCSGSVATAIRVLGDFTEQALGAGDRVVFTGASSAVAQILLQLAAWRGLESVCLVNTEEEAALALRLGAWKATLLKEFKAMRMNNAHLVADGEGGVLGFTAARALRFRGCYVSYADVSGGGVSVPVAGQIFGDTRCRGFSLSRWASTRPASESRELVRRSLETAAAAGLRLEMVREFGLSAADAAVEAARTPGGPVLLRG